MNEVYFYVGQTVYSVDFGKGKVISDNHSESYPIRVLFEKRSESYTFDGRIHKRAPIYLFQQPINLPTNKPIIRIKKGDLVWVRDYEENQWECRYFSHFSDFSRTKAVCFTDQRPEGDLKEWLYYSEFEIGGGSYFYTYDGRIHINALISLFQQPINLPTNKPIITLKKGDLVWVKDYEENQWECRYFSHFSDFSRTKAVCFIDQRRDTDLKEWRFYSEFENIPF